jgi:hypothetical protein
MMVTIKKYYENIELSIWLALIPRMKETHPLGMAIQSFYSLFCLRAVDKSFIIGLLSIMLGLMAGMALAFARWMAQ